MTTITKRDTRGTEIKRLLQGLYPQAQFRVLQHMEKIKMSKWVAELEILLEAEGQREAENIFDEYCRNLPLDVVGIVKVTQVGDIVRDPIGKHTKFSLLE